MIKDAGRIQALLGIVEKVTTVMPGATHIISEAMSELRLLNEGIRKEHEAEANKPVTPAKVGDPESPQNTVMPAEGGTEVKGDSLASKPTDKKLDTDTKPPPVTKPAEVPVPNPPKNDTSPKPTNTPNPGPAPTDEPVIDRRV